MRYKTSNNIGVKLNLADKNINTLYLAIISAVFSLFEIHKYLVGNNVVVSLQELNLVLAVMYIVYMGLFVLVIRLYNRCVYPTNLIIDNGRVTLQSYIYRFVLEVEFIDLIDSDKSICDEFNVFEPVCINISKDKVVVLDKAELSKLSSL